MTQLHEIAQMSTYNLSFLTLTYTLSVPSVYLSCLKLIKNLLGLLKISKLLVAALLPRFLDFCRWSAFGSVCGQSVVDVLHFDWSVVGFYFRKWSVVGVLISIWSVVGGSWSVVGGFLLRRVKIAANGDKGNNIYMQASSKK